MGADVPSSGRSKRHWGAGWAGRSRQHLRGARKAKRVSGGKGHNHNVRTLEHVLDEDAALGDLLVDDELLIVRRNEENHVVVIDDGVGGVREWWTREGDTGLENKMCEPPLLKDLVGPRLYVSITYA